MITSLPFYTILITLLYSPITPLSLYFSTFLFPSFPFIIPSQKLSTYSQFPSQLIHLSTKLSTYQHIIVFSISPYISSISHHFPSFHFPHKFLHISSWQQPTFMLYSSQLVKKPNKTLTFSFQNPQCFIDN